jgi:hypothetical protein
MMPDLYAWRPWSPDTVAQRLAGLDVRWCVAAGWAVDLFRGAVTRDHHDLEIAVPRQHFALVAERFPDCDFHVPAAGRLTPATDELIDDPDRHQTWALDRAERVWRLDVFREPHDGDTWICRRDERIRRPYAEVIRHTPAGVPYLTPEIVLLFKAKTTRDKDQYDFDGALPLLDAGQRDWLDDALAAIHPEHRWRSALRAVR